MFAAQIGSTLRSPKVASRKIINAMQTHNRPYFRATPPARSISHSALMSKSARDSLPDCMRQTALLTPKECAIVVEAAQRSLALWTNRRPLALINASGNANAATARKSLVQVYENELNALMQNKKVALQVQAVETEVTRTSNEDSGKDEPSKAGSNPGWRAYWQSLSLKDKCLLILAALGYIFITEPYTAWMLSHGYAV